MNNFNDLRDAITNALMRLKQSSHINISLLTVDSKTSSKVQEFEKQFPNDFFDLGIAEQHVINVAAGMASCGICPVVIGIGAFVIMRCFEQIRTMVAYNNYNVKLIGLWSGLYYTDQGHTHTLIEDIALMRTLPNTTIYSPSDYKETTAVVYSAIETQGFSYIRVDHPLFSKNYHDESFVFKRGVGEIINNGNDLTLIATGKTVYDAMEAAKILKQKNISCRVINMCTLKPIDRQLIIESAIQTKGIITIEEHKTTGGLGSIVSEILCLNVDKYVPFKTIGVDTDYFYKNLRYNQAKEEYGITPANIVSTAELIYKGAK